MKAELVVAVPRLMEFLSRTGNTDHGIHREQSCLQGMQRMHSLARMHQMRGRIYTIEGLAKTASMGMGEQFFDKHVVYGEFAKQWSGGTEGTVLLELQLYEKSLNVKRKVALSDIRAMAALELSEAPLYAPAMLKSLLSAPPELVTEGTAVGFTSGDYSSLGPLGKNRAAAVNGHYSASSISSVLLSYHCSHRTVHVFFLHLPSYYCSQRTGRALLSCYCY